MRRRGGRRRATTTAVLYSVHDVAHNRVARAAAGWQACARAVVAGRGVDERHEGTKDRGLSCYEGYVPPAEHVFFHLHRVGVSQTWRCARCSPNGERALQLACTSVWFLTYFGLKLSRF